MANPGENTEAAIEAIEREIAELRAKAALAERVIREYRTTGDAERVWEIDPDLELRGAAERLIGALDRAVAAAAGE